jgi:hypothetical protein
MEEIESNFKKQLLTKNTNLFNSTSSAEKKAKKLERTLILQE